MAKKMKISQKDIDIFLKAVKDARPLKQGKIPLKPGRRKQPVSRMPDEESSIPLFDGSELDANLQADDFIRFKRDGVSDKILRKLRKGQYNVEARLDLHRLTVEEARREVNDFLHACLDSQIRVAIIIHGKGMPGKTPVLKNQVNYWLRQVNTVLAFCSAPRSLGGSGAIIVLLKSMI